jgi:hypothetical protein
MIRSIGKKEPFVRKRSHFPYEIAIITNGNPILLRDTTLNILKAYHIPFEKITIFIKTNSEEQLYKSKLLSSTYGKLVPTSTSTIPEFYNWIQSYYIPGTPVVYIKDSIKYILELSSSGIQPLKSLVYLIKSGFSECTKQNTCLWGLSSSISSMLPSMHYCLSYIPGMLWGSIIPGPSISLRYPVLEDYERSIQTYIKFGSLVQFSMITAVNCIKETIPAELAEKTMRRFARTYKDYVKLHTGPPLSIVLTEPECKIMT